MGVKYGAWVIEESSSPEEMAGVEEEHWSMIYAIATLDEMKQIATDWQQVLVLQKSMRELVNKALKSSDILYPCRFCKRLWEA